MNITIFSKGLNLTAPWYVKETKLDIKNKKLEVWVDFEKGAKFYDEVTKQEYTAYSTEQKTWQHLFFWQYQTYIHVRVPRIKDKNGNYQLLACPLARNESGFTLLCEAFIIELVKQMPISKVARMLKVSDGKIMRIIQYYVDKSKSVADFSQVKHIGIDETSRKKGHEYITVMTNLDSGKILSIVTGKGKDAVENAAKDLEVHHGKRGNIQEVSIDLSPAFTAGVHDSFPKAEITYDRFHVMQIVNKALNSVRIQEAKGNAILKKSKFLFLSNSKNLSEEKKQRLDYLKMENKVLAEAYQMKENLILFFEQKTPKAAETYLQDWCDWVESCSITPMIEVVKTIKKHWNGILRYAYSRISNGISEGVNSVIQLLKRRARGYRNTSNFITIIFLKLADFPILTNPVYLT